MAGDVSGWTSQLLRQARGNRQADSADAKLVEAVVQARDERAQAEARPIAIAIHTGRKRSSRESLVNTPSSASEAGGPSGCPEREWECRRVEFGYGR